MGFSENSTFLGVNNDLKLLILEKVPFIKPFDHFLISRKHNFNANFKFFGNVLRNCTFDA